MAFTNKHKKPHTHTVFHKHTPIRIFINTHSHTNIITLTSTQTHKYNHTDKKPTIIKLTNTHTHPNTHPNTHKHNTYRQTRAQEVLVRALEFLSLSCFLFSKGKKRSGPDKRSRSLRGWFNANTLIINSE